MCPGCGLGNRLGRMPTAGCSPLSYAAEEGREAVVKILLAQDDIEVRRGRSSLSTAVQFGHEAVVKILVARDDVDVNNTDTYGHSQLSYTAQHGHQAVVELLVAQDNTDVNNKDKSGHSPLSYAVQYGRQAVVNIFMVQDDGASGSGRAPCGTGRHQREQQRQVWLFAAVICHPIWASGGGKHLYGAGRR